MAQPLDLDAYLARIKYSGPRTPTYDTLAGILRAHTVSIPFESFDVLLGRRRLWVISGHGAQVRYRSASPRKADIRELRHVRFVPIGDITRFV